MSIVGTSFDKHVTVAAGGRRLEVTGPQAAIIGHVAGADVAVTGTISGNTIEAKSFVVRTVDNQPALDGVLKTEGPTLYLVTAGNVKHRIVAAPPPLLGHDGDRVWITGDPAKGVSSFGFIDPAR